MKKQTDIVFYSRRAKQSRAAAAAAGEVCARDAHEAFAVAYEKLLARTVAKQETAPAPARGTMIALPTNPQE